VLIRKLPGILESGLWPALDALPRLPTRALVADVGNDILYGVSAERILAWIDEILGRLQRLTRDIILTDLPLAGIRPLSPARFLLVRSILFPSCRLSLGHVLGVARRVNAGLVELATVRGARLFRLDPTWYGIDPIHIRPAAWRSAWPAILGARAAVNGRGSWREGLALCRMRPERRWLLGVQQFTPQSGVALPMGGRLWLY
jgi:hypothetical protein